MNDKELLLEAINRQLKMQRSRKGKQTAMNEYFVLGKNEEGVIAYGERIDGNCYASLRRQLLVGVHRYLMSSVMRDQHGFKATETVHEPYMDYILNRSPYKDIFVIKDVDYCLNYGVLVDTDNPGNVILSGLTLTRMLWEYTSIPLFWAELKKLGVQEDLALLAAHCISRDKDGYHYGLCATNHFAFDLADMTEGTVKNYLEGKAVNADKVTMLQSGNFGGVQKLFDGDGKKFLSGYKAKDEVVVQTWGGARKVGRDATLEPFAAWLKDWYAENILGEKPEKKAKVVKVKSAKAKKELTAEQFLMQCLKVENGFTLAEVRKYRAALRKLIALGEGNGWRYPNIAVKLASFSVNIAWATARRTVGVDFLPVHTKCRDNGVYDNVRQAA